MEKLDIKLGKERQCHIKINWGIIFRLTSGLVNPRYSRIDES